MTDDLFAVSNRDRDDPRVLVACNEGGEVAAFPANVRCDGGTRDFVIAFSWLRDDESISKDMDALQLGGFRRVNRVNAASAPALEEWARKFNAEILIDPRIEQFWRIADITFDPDTEDLLYPERRAARRMFD